MIADVAAPLPPSLLKVLHQRGYRTQAQIDQVLSPSLDLVPFSMTDMEKAVDRLRLAIRQEEPIALYADRDVDGLTGLAILVRSLRTLGALVQWGSPIQGRGLQRAVLESNEIKKASVALETKFKPRQQELEKLQQDL